MDYLGIEGMKAVVAGLHEEHPAADRGDGNARVPRAASPDVNVATFICDNAQVPGPWRVSWTCRKHLRIVCMPHVHAGRIEAFLQDIGESHA